MAEPSAQTRTEEIPSIETGWVSLGDATALPNSAVARTEIDGRGIAVIRCQNKLFAIDDTCSHAEASLSDGDLIDDECAIECPLHGSRFDLGTGAALCFPAVEAVASHSVKEWNGELWLKVSQKHS